MRLGFKCLSFWSAVVVSLSVLSFDFVSSVGKTFASPSEEPIYLPLSFKCEAVKRVGDRWIEHCENSEIVCYTTEPWLCKWKDPK